MPLIACLPLLFATVFVGSIPQSGPQDLLARQQAMRLGLAYVAQGTEETSDESAINGLRDLHYPKLDERSEHVLKEIEQLGEHDWAGAYYCGDGLGMNVTLTIAPVAGATYTWSGCTGLYDLNHGDIVVASDDSISLDLVIDPALNNRWYQCTMPRHFMSAEWIVARWGAERYLIPSSQMIPFCNAASQGDWVSDFPRRGGRQGMSELRETPPEGLPVVPERYRPFLLREPLTGSLITADEPQSIGTFGGGQPEKFLVRAEVDLGADRGLLPGMELFVTERGGRARGEVVSVSEQRAIVEFRFAIYDARRDIPKQGWSVSTRAPARPMPLTELR